MRKHNKFLKKIKKIDDDILNLQYKREEFICNYILSLAKYKIGDFIQTKSGKIGIIDEICYRNRQSGFELNDVKVFYKIIKVNPDTLCKIIDTSKYGTNSFVYFNDGNNILEEDIFPYNVNTLL